MATYTITINEINSKVRTFIKYLKKLQLNQIATLVFKE